MANGIDPASIYGYNPYKPPPSLVAPQQPGDPFNAFAGSPTTPYYDPFNPNLGSGQPNAPTAPITSSPISSVASCEDGYVMDEETNTCVPIEVAFKAVNDGDRDRDSFGSTHDGKGGYVSFRDLFDGGGAGFYGPKFEGPLSVTKGLNALGVRPKGYRDNFEGKDTVDGLQGLSKSSIADLEKSGHVPKGTTKNYYENPVYTDDNDDGLQHATGHGETVNARNRYKDAATGTAKIKNQDGSTRVVATYNDDEVKAISARTHTPGRNNGGLISMNDGGMTPMNPMIAYRQEGGLLPGAVPPTEAPQGPLPGAMPPTNPQGPEMAPQGQPTPPQAPPAPPERMTFAQKVDAALEGMQSGRSTVPTPKAETQMGALRVMDMQGDGPVSIAPGAGGIAPGSVGPDMGPDTIDTELEEGSMVMNPEASEMYEEELMQYANGGYVA